MISENKILSVSIFGVKCDVSKDILELIKSAFKSDEVMAIVDDISNYYTIPSDYKIPSEESNLSGRFAALQYNLAIDRMVYEILCIVNEEIYTHFEDRITMLFEIFRRFVSKKLVDTDIFDEMRFHISGI